MLAFEGPQDWDGDMRIGHAIASRPDEREADPPDVVAARIRVDAIWAEIDRRAEDRPLDTGHYDDGHSFGWKAPGAQSKDGAVATVPWWHRAWVMVIAALMAIALVGGIVAVVLGSSHHGVKNSVRNTSQAGAPVVASHIVSDKQLGNCTFKVTLDYQIVNNGSRFAGKTAVLRFPGSTEGIERVPVADNGTFQASATVPGKSTAPGSCTSSVQYHVISIGGQQPANNR